jgi:hypothetical protein
MIREAVGVFDNPDELNAAVAELEVTAFPRDAISVLGRADALQREFGVSDIRPEDAEDNPDIPRAVPVRPEEKTITIAASVGIGVYAVLTGAVLALGPAPSGEGLAATLLVGAVIAALAAVVARRLMTRYRRDREQQLRAGGMVLWVRTPDPDQEYIARTILARHGAKDVHVHAIH